MNENMQGFNIGIEVTLKVIGGKWKPLILCYLKDLGTKRNGELKRLIPNITQKVLTQQLRELEEDKVIIRKVYNELPLKVEYEVSDYGKSLYEILSLMCKWGSDHYLDYIENKK